MIHTQFTVEIGDVIVTMSKQEYTVQRVYKKCVQVHRPDGRLAPLIMVNHGSIAWNKGHDEREKRLNDAIDDLTTL